MKIQIFTNLPRAWIVGVDADRQHLFDKVAGGWKRKSPPEEQG